MIGSLKNKFIKYNFLLSLIVITLNANAISDSNIDV